MAFVFYDVESLGNAFTLCVHHERENLLEVYVLCDDSSIADSDGFAEVLSRGILAKNPDFSGTVSVLDLRYEEANVCLAETFGLSDSVFANDPSYDSSYPAEFRLVCDTDPNYDPDVFPYLVGYNSKNYDLTMISIYLVSVFSGEGRSFSPISAREMRGHNDALFSDAFRDFMPSYLTSVMPGAGRVRRNMLSSGRHVDAARLNERQSKVALKRLLGMLGLRILESDKLATGSDFVTNVDELVDLVAYNASDVFGLEALFGHGLYSNQFELKKGLLDKYPELVYERAGTSYRPDVRPSRVRRDRLTPDSSSARFATLCLCPYGSLDDLDVVSYDYPSPEKARELGKSPSNVLEDCRKWFYDLFPQEEPRKAFDSVYRFYKGLEGKNFNSSAGYRKARMGRTFSEPTIFAPLDSRNVGKADTCLPYYDSDGNPTSCFVTFSIGGIHGAEYDKDAYDADVEEWERFSADLSFVENVFPNPCDFKKAKTVETSDGRVLSATKFLKSGSTGKNASYKEAESVRPVLFKKGSSGSAKLNEKYSYVSYGEVNHEDFSSYYPNLLMMMSAFSNPSLGEDRYAEMFENKQRYGKAMKDESATADERGRYRILREGTKLILNSASGAGDTNFESPIRMNNRIISMRVIGQLFSWRIGQAQAYEGGKIVSTNTDGLYSVMDKMLNDAVLERESESVGVEIEPETIRLVSKDSNNRIEISVDGSRILGASGSALSCWEGPTPAKSLNHPAICDLVLARYLSEISSNVDASTLPFDFDVGRRILGDVEAGFDDFRTLLMYQNVVASSPGSTTYVYALKGVARNEVEILGHYNRVFVLKDGTPGTVGLAAATCRKITDAMRRKRERDGLDEVEVEPTAETVLLAERAKIPIGCDVVSKKVTGIDREWSILVENGDLRRLGDERTKFILDSLDREKYLRMVADAFDDGWRNRPRRID